MSSPTAIVTNANAAATVEDSNPTATVEDSNPTATVSPAGPKKTFDLFASLSLSASVDMSIEGDVSSGLSIETISPADLNTILGQTPTYMWRGGDAADAAELVSGILPLTDQGTPTKEYVSSPLGGKVTRLTAIADGMKELTGAADQVGTDSFAVLWIGYPETQISGTHVYGWRSSGGAKNGAELYCVPTLMAWNVDTTGTFISRLVNGDHQDDVTVAWMGRNASETWLHTQLGSSVAGGPSAGSASGAFINLGNLSPNSGGNDSYNPCQHGLFAMWQGASADAFSGTEAERLLVQNALYP